MADRWPTALALVFIAGAIAVIALVDREAELFGPSVAVMAGIYLMAYAIGWPWTAWLAFVLLSAVMTVLQQLRRTEVLDVDPGISMTVVAVVMGVGTAPVRRHRDVLPSAV